MDLTTSRRLAVPAAALAAVLALAACGGAQTDTAATGTSSSGHGAGHSTEGGTGQSVQGNDADVAFLTGMKPHHEQAVEMSEIVLAADPPAEVAALARRVRGAQAPEIEQMDQMLDALGHEGDGAHGTHGAGHADAHGGMMSDQAMSALRAATGTDAARLYLEGMIGHHEGAIDASDDEIASGEYAPAVELAKQIKRAQAQEIAEMRRLLAAL